jgi:hypothetical protein
MQSLNVKFIAPFQPTESSGPTGSPSPRPTEPGLQVPEGRTRGLGFGTLR